MKRWALLISVLYISMLGILSMPIVLAALYPLKGFKDAAEFWKGVRETADMYGYWQWWLFLAVMGLAQAALLAVPVRLVSRRPMTRCPLALTVLTGSLMMGALVTGAIYSLAEFAFAENAGDQQHGVLTNWIALAMGVAAWCGWGLIFSSWPAGGGFILTLRSEFTCAQCSLDAGPLGADPADESHTPAPAIPAAAGSPRAAGRQTKDRPIASEHRASARASRPI